MRILTVLFLLLLISPAYSQLTKEELRTIIREEVRLIIKEEVRPIIKEEIAASEKRTREYIDLKVDALDQRVDDVNKNLNDKIDALDKSLNARMNDMQIMMVALVALIAAAIALPQIIIAYKDRGQKELRAQHREMQAQIDQLREKLAVPSPSSHNPDKI